MPLRDHPELAARFVVEAEFQGAEGHAFAVRTGNQGETLLLKLMGAGGSLAEGSLLASLDHPGVPKIHEVGRTADQTSYVLRAFAPGRPLAGIGRLDGERALAVATQLGEILAFVHLRGILHLDVKPANVIVQVGADGSVQVQLVDFGFAQRGHARAVRGTPFFAAPEVALGEEPDQRADLFSLGATLLAALVPDLQARLAGFFLRFPREDFLAALGISARELPVPFDRVLPRLLERRPEYRFADAQELLEALRGRGGRPSLAALALDPVAFHGAELDTIANDLAPGVDLLLHGLLEDDRRALALHVACTLGDVRSVEHRQDAVRLLRGGAATRTVELREVQRGDLADFLTRALGLDEEPASTAAEVLLAAGAHTATQCTRHLHRLAKSGSIVPDGAQWCWPDAAAGRIDLDRDSATDDDDQGFTIGERILRLASRGRLDAAQALASEQLTRTDVPEKELRTALARGLLAAGEPIRALPLTHDLPLLRARATLESGDVRGAERVIALLPDGVDESERALLRASLRYQQGRFDEGLAELGGAAPDNTRVLVLEGALRAAKADYPSSRVLLDRAIAALSPDDQPFARAAALVARGDLARRCGDLQAALTYQDDALALFRRTGNAHAAASASLNLGVVAKDLGDRRTAREHLRRARALFLHVGDRARELTAEANLGIVLLADGDPSSAIPRFDAAIEGLSELGAGATVELCRAFRAQALARTGDRARAEQDLEAVATTGDLRVQDEAATARAVLAGTHENIASEEPMTIPTERLEDGISRAVFRTFLAVNRRLASERDLEHAMTSLLEAAETVTGARASYLLVERSSGLKLELASRIGSPHDRAFSRSLANKALSAGRTMTAEDALGDRDLMNMPSVRDLRVRSALCAPFHSASGSAGALYVEHSGRAGAFGPREAELLEALADQASIAVERMLREEDLAEELLHSKRDLQVAQRRLGRAREGRIIGKSPAVLEMRRHVERFAKSDLSVLIQGETGTGKELVARALHDSSPRAAGPFVSENCSAIPPELMESELFGHQKGAFTGADQDRAGLIELANGGTLFLDEVGDMPQSMQVKLLRALQERTIRRVGAREAIAFDVRLVSATHKDLPALVKAGEFREDLYFRLAAGTIRVPPLRERPGDVDLLAGYFVDQLNTEQGRSLKIDENGLARLRTAAWPGNVRELEHVIARAFLLSEGVTLDLNDLPTAARSPDPDEIPATPARWPAIPLNEAIYRTLHAALRATVGDKSRAAKLLQISRTALYEKLRREETDRPTPGSFPEL